MRMLVDVELACKDVGQHNAGLACDYVGHTMWSRLIVQLSTGIRRYWELTTACT